MLVFLELDHLHIVNLIVLFSYLNHKVIDSRVDPFEFLEFLRLLLLLLKMLVDYLLLNFILSFNKWSDNWSRKSDFHILHGSVALGRDVVLQII